MELRELLKRLKDMGGSDLHLVAGLPPAVRVHNELTLLRDVGRPTPEQMREMIYPILAKEEIERFENDPHFRYDLDFARGVADLGRFRFNLHKQRGSLSCTIRALSGSIPSLESLGLPPGVRDFTGSLRGLVLVTGPGGSGRSTTLASLVDEINHQRSARIMTIEDPVEYVIPSDRAIVTQREVGDGADTLSFENAMRYARRQDIDVLMVGYLGTPGTMQQALELAEMGLLVLGCVTTTSAVQTLMYYIDCFPADQQAQVVSKLSSNLLGTISQILLPRSDHRGRVLACEVMKVNVLIRSEIRQRKFDTIYTIMQASAAEGMQTMDQSLVDLARQNLIDYATARPYIREEATHRMVYQLTGAGHAGVPAPAAAGEKAAVIAPGLSDSQIRRRLGTAAIPPWEKQP
ncbi:MAG: PilT/PilU family type 4a pilus ATPase [Candidatus Sumerlaeia bacterium]|nr:PilT/PilU family type 4a pilus ATPase [Candidatus Sumerlaeia bacterium]